MLLLIFPTQKVFHRTKRGLLRACTSIQIRSNGGSARIKLSVPLSNWSATPMRSRRMVLHLKIPFEGCYAPCNWRGWKSATCTCRYTYLYVNSANFRHQWRLAKADGSATNGIGLSDPAKFFAGRNSCLVVLPIVPMISFDTF